MRSGKDIHNRISERQQTVVHISQCQHIKYILPNWIWLTNYYYYIRLTPGIWLWWDYIHSSNNNPWFIIVLLKGKFAHACTHTGKTATYGCRFNSQTSILKAWKIWTKINKNSTNLDAMCCAHIVGVLVCLLPPLACGIPCFPKIWYAKQCRYCLYYRTRCLSMLLLRASVHSSSIQARWQSTLAEMLTINPNNHHAIVSPLPIPFSVFACYTSQPRISKFKR